MLKINQPPFNTSLMGVVKGVMELEEFVRKVHK